MLNCFLLYLPLFFIILALLDVRLNALYCWMLLQFKGLNELRTNQVFGVVQSEQNFTVGVTLGCSKEVICRKLLTNSKVIPLSKALIKRRLSEASSYKIICNSLM